MQLEETLDGADVCGRERHLEQKWKTLDGADVSGSSEDRRYPLLVNLVKYINTKTYKVCIFSDLEPITLFILSQSKAGKKRSYKVPGQNSTTPELPSHKNMWKEDIMNCHLKQPPI